MRRPRRWITEGSGPKHYHVVSRIVNRDYLFGVEEKEYFRKIMRKLEAFSGVKVLTYCIMSNHFHLLLEVPDQEDISDKELIRRIGLLYSTKYTAEFKQQLDDAHASGDEASILQLRQRYLYRMNDLSMFMKDLKQRFTQWFNHRNDRKGTLWEERFRCLLVEGSDHALMTIASYIDLNPVRARICEDPKNYRFSGYGEAIGGQEPARSGLIRLLKRYAGSTDWVPVAEVYRTHLYGISLGRGMATDDGASGTIFDREEALKVLRAKGKLTQHQLIQCRVRYMTDGAVLGSRLFVDQFFQSHRQSFGKSRSSGARKMKGSDWGGLHVLRDLKTNLIQ